MLRQWAALSWLLPREQRATALAVSWLQHRALRGWRQWLQERRRWHQLGDSLAAQWTNLHLGAAWQAWRTWVQRRQDKAQLASSITKRWTNLHLAAAFQAWMELVQVSRLLRFGCMCVAERGCPMGCANSSVAGVVLESLNCAEVCCVCGRCCA